MPQVSVVRIHYPIPDEQSELAVLLTEINTAAIRIRQRGRPISGNLSEIPGAEHAVLEVIERLGAITVPQIARERSTSRQNIQILVDRLISRGQVELATNPAHKRSVLVQLTSRGKVQVDAGSSSQKRLLANLGTTLPVSEIATTVRVLRRIQSLLSDDLQNGERIASTETGAEVIGSIPERHRSHASVVVNTTPPETEEFPLNLL